MPETIIPLGYTHYPKPKGKGQKYPKVTTDLIMIKGRNQKGTISAGGTRYLSLKFSVHPWFDCLYGIYIQYSYCSASCSMPVTLHLGDTKTSRTRAFCGWAGSWCPLKMWMRKFACVSPVEKLPPLHNHWLFNSVKEKLWITPSELAKNDLLFFAHKVIQIQHVLAVKKSSIAGRGNIELLAEYLMMNK